MDARTVSSAYAQFLRSFCTWSHMSLDRVGNDSLASVLINPQALSSTMLKAKVNDAFQEARDTGPLLMTTHVGFFIVPNAFLLRSNCVLNATAEARLGAAKMKHLLHLNTVEERRQTHPQVASERVSATNASSRNSSNK